MKKYLTLVALLFCTPMFAGPVGKWKTIDDESKKAKSIVEIYQAKDGTLEGKVFKLLQKPGAVCKKCEGKNKGKPIEGMVILWGLKKDGDRWTAGTILDPAKGKTYAADIEVIDGGKALKVTGKLFVFSRSQIWKKP